MAKKKALVNLKTQNIEFSLKNITYKVVSFNPNIMALDVTIEEDGSTKLIKGFPFAHAPKEIKKIIRPN